MKKEKTYYEILEIETSADKQIIKESFRKMSLRYHPDLNREPEMDYVIILEAYKTLIDDKKRDEYNHSIGLKIRIKDTNCGMTQIPPNRIEYCLSMKLPHCTHERNMSSCQPCRRKNFPLPASPNDPPEQWCERNLCPVTLSWLQQET